MTGDRLDRRTSSPNVSRSSGSRPIARTPTRTGARQPRRCSASRPGQLDRLIRTRAGSKPVRRGVYRIAGTPETWQQFLMAACLARPGSYASFRTAAALWDLEGFARRELEITVPGSRTGAPRWRHRPREPGGRARDTWPSVERIPTSSMARTLCDLTAVVQPWMVERAVDEALRRKLVTLRGARGGRRGSRRARTPPLHGDAGDPRAPRLPATTPARATPRSASPNSVGASRTPRSRLASIGCASARTRYRIDLCYPEAQDRDRVRQLEAPQGSSRRSTRPGSRQRSVVLLGFQRAATSRRDRATPTIVDTVAAALARATVS